MATGSTTENRDQSQGERSNSESEEEMLWHGGAAPTDEADAEQAGGEEEIPLEEDRRGQDEKSPRYGDSPQDRNLASAGLGGIGEGSTR